jgi:hypothetical protein
MSSKLIVTNYGAFETKYGKPGVQALKQAVVRMVAADKQRAILTRVADLSNAQNMKAAGGKRVADPADQKANKDAVDALFRKARPDYLMILGSVDVVPHQDMDNPFRGGDDDPTVPGDLPYACEAPYSTGIEKFKGPTRVVGRLPNVTGDTAPDYLVKLLDGASGYTKRPRTDYASYLGLTAEIWSESTRESIANIFGLSDAMSGIPPLGPVWQDAQLAARCHFVNCHGSDTAPEFYGQPRSGARKYPVAHEAEAVVGKLSQGTIAAMECCYGGQLYDPEPAGVHASIVNTYLANGCYGYLGSTTIAYGPASGQGSADLICQYFIKNILGGASVGRAALMARQQFVQAAGTLDPADVKTLGQFNLLGDPSVHPVEPPPGVSGGDPKLLEAADGVSGAKNLGADDLLRTLRRAELVDVGLRLANTAAAAFSASSPIPGGQLVKALAAIAQEAGLINPKFLRFETDAPAPSAWYAKSKMAETPTPSFCAAVGQVEAPDAPGPQYSAVIGTVLDGKLVSARQLYSR